MMLKAFINAICIILLFLLFSIYSLHIKVCYPAFIINTMCIPYGRFIWYIISYLISYYNILIGLLFIMNIISIHNEILILSYSQSDNKCLLR